MFDKIFHSASKPDDTFEVVGAVLAQPRSGRVNLEKRFTIIAESGQGSMSRVFRATDGESGRTICLKVQDREKTAAAFARSGLVNRPSEGAIGMAVTHPHVVRTLEFGTTTKGDSYIVMEFIDGVSLSFVRESRSLDLAAKIELLAQAGEGLAAVHEAGFIHHDFGPKNLLVDRNDQAKLIDFGLAVPNTEVFHRPGNRTGTLHYMAPELLRREPTDERIDIFSFGVTMYEFLTGKLPYDATTNSLAQMLQRINHPPVDIAQAGPHLPEDLCELVKKAMARNPKDRWPTMTALTNDLRRLESVTPPAEVVEGGTGRPAVPNPTEPDDDDFLASLGVAPEIEHKADQEHEHEHEPAPPPDARGQPRAPASPIPKRVRHEVWARDKGRCVQCGSNQDIKFKHIVPVARGGEHTVENVRILCKACRHAKRA
jgi:serine/threonine protein kinase